MITLAISLAFGLTFGFIMCLVLWLNTRLNFQEFLCIIIMTLISSLVWQFAHSTQQDKAMILLIVAWTLIRILMERWRIFEKIITFAMSVNIVINYYIYLTFIGMRAEAVSLQSLFYMMLYLLIIGAIFVVMVLLKISFFSNKWVRDFFYHEDPNVKRHRMTLFSAIMFLTVLTIVGTYFSVEMLGNQSNAMFYTGFAFFFSFVFIIISFVMLKTFVEYSILSDATEQEKQHQKELKAFIKMIREQRHDFNLHLHAVNGLLEAEKYDECKAYVAKMVNSSAYINEVLPVYDTSISALLHAYRADAESMGIHMTFDITNNLKKAAPEPYEINRIIGNLLQNAIEAVSSSKDRDYGIIVKISSSSAGSVIDVSNKFFGDESELDHLFDYSFSGKKSHEGIGLSTVQRIAESYKGIAYVEMDEDIIHFIVRLPDKNAK